MPRPTLDELLTTPTGQAMLAELDAEQVAAEEVADDKRAENCARWQSELDDLAPDYEAVRVDALADLHNLALTTMELVSRRSRIRTLVAAIRKAGGDPGDVPMDLFHDARRPFLKDVEIIRERLPRSI